MACLERETWGAISPVRVPLGLPPAPIARAWAELSAPPLLPGHHCLSFSP